MDFANDLEKVFDAFGVWNDGVQEDNTNMDKTISEKQFQYAKQKLIDLLIDVTQKGIEGDMEELRQILYYLQKY